MESAFAYALFNAEIFMKLVGYFVYQILHGPFPASILQTVIYDPVPETGEFVLGHLYDFLLI
ncbi:MAG: hypothetical protein ACOCUL_02495 [Bacteroidota bacterium]